MYYKELRKDKYESLDKELFLLKPIASNDLIKQIKKILCIISVMILTAVTNLTV